MLESIIKHLRVSVHFLSQKPFLVELYFLEIFAQIQVCLSI